MHQRNNWLWLAMAPLAVATLLALFGAMRVTAQPPTAATTGSLIGLVFDPIAQSEHVAQIDPVTGAATPIGAGIAACCKLVGLDAALDAASGQMYAVLSTLADSTPRLYAFDIATGAASASQPLATSAAVNFLAVDPTNGQVLALVFESATNSMRLVQVDPTSGVFTPRGAPLANCCSIATLDNALDAANRRLYAAMRPLDSFTSTLFTLDIDTGNVLATTELAPFVSVNYLVFDDEAGVLRAVVNDPQSDAERLAIITPASGAITMTGEGAAGCCNLLTTDSTIDADHGWLTVPMIGADDATFLFSFDLGTGSLVHAPAVNGAIFHYVKFYSPPPPPVLGVQKVAPEAVGPGATIDYELAVENQGGSTATNVVLRDVLPDGAELVAASPGAVLEPATETQAAALRWSMGTLAANARRTASFSMRGSLALVNEDYRATASGGVVAVGRRPVVTLVGEEISAIDATIEVMTATTITTAGGDLRILVPPGAVTSTTTVRVVASGKPADILAFTDISFNIVLTDAEGSPLLSVLKPMTLIVAYDDDWLAANLAQESDLNLYRWQAGVWIPPVPCVGCMQDSNANQFVVLVDRPGLYALRGATRLYLPSVSRNP